MLIGMEHRKGGVKGHIFCCYLRRPVPFEDITELVFRIAGIGGLLNVPGAAEEYRSLPGETDRSPELLPKEYQEILPPEEAWCGGKREFYKIKTKEMLYLHLAGRQNWGASGTAEGPSDKRKVCIFPQCPGADAPAVGGGSEI